jgi:hypothetical protein
MSGKERSERTPAAPGYPVPSVNLFYPFREATPTNSVTRIVDAYWEQWKRNHLLELENKMNPTELGEMLVENARSKYGDTTAAPFNMLSSDAFEKFCSGRSFTDADRAECERAYKSRWNVLTGYPS